MNLSESFKQAFDSLKANKLRSILTMVGIVMGVFSIITIVAVGNATKAYIDKEFQKLGANIIMIMYKSGDIGSGDYLTMEDFDVIKKVAPDISSIGTNATMSGSIRIKDKVRNVAAIGVSSQYKDIFPLEMASGRFVNEIDVSTQSNVIVVDETFAKKYFKSIDVIGHTLILKSSTGTTSKMRIIGVIKKPETIFGVREDNEDSPTSAYIPISTLKKMYPSFKNLDQIFVSISEKDDVKLRRIADKITKALEVKHNNKDKYMIAFFSDLQNGINSILGVISAVLLVIALITLLVGGIGIVNILLVSVTERIREIGIRKALGAQKRDIIFQFITEAVILTGISGIVGIIMGVSAGAIISSRIKIPPVVDLNIIVLAFLGSVALGLAFGVYPAKRAADLDPIESLRYE